jgi:hypothetical protein
MKEKEEDALKRFISRKGGYQGDTGVGGWFRNTYWVPLDLFEEPLKGWLECEKQSYGGENVRQLRPKGAPTV